MFDWNTFVVRLLFTFVVFVPVFIFLWTIDTHVIIIYSTAMLVALVVSSTHRYIQSWREKRRIDGEIRQWREKEDEREL